MQDRSMSLIDATTAHRSQHEVGGLQPLHWHTSSEVSRYPPRDVSMDVSSAFRGAGNGRIAPVGQRILNKYFNYMIVYNQEEREGRERKGG